MRNTKGQFQLGHSGGRPKGARNKLAAQVFEDILHHWCEPAAPGSKLCERCRGTGNALQRKARRISPVLPPACYRASSLTFLAAPIAEANSRSIAGASVDVSGCSRTSRSSGAGSPRHDIRLPVPCADDLRPFRAMGDWSVITADQATCSSCSGRRQINELQHARTARALRKGG